MRTGGCHGGRSAAVAPPSVLGYVLRTIVLKKRLCKKKNGEYYTVSNCMRHVIVPYTVGLSVNPGHFSHFANYFFISLIIEL